MNFDFFLVWNFSTQRCCYGTKDHRKEQCHEVSLIKAPSPEELSHRDELVVHIIFVQGFTAVFGHKNSDEIEKEFNNSLEINQLESLRSEGYSKPKETFKPGIGDKENIIDFNMKEPVDDTIKAIEGDFFTL